MACYFCEHPEEQDTLFHPDPDKLHVCVLCSELHPVGTYCSNWATVLRTSDLGTLRHLAPSFKTCSNCFQPWKTTSQAALCCTQPSIGVARRWICSLCSKHYSTSNHLRTHTLHNHLGTPICAHCAHCWRVFPQTEIGRIFYAIHRGVYHQDARCNYFGAGTIHVLRSLEDADRVRISGGPQE